MPFHIAGLRPVAPSRLLDFFPHRATETFGITEASLPELKKCIALIELKKRFYVPDF